jgi:hypothetical protein
MKHAACLLLCVGLFFVPAKSKAEPWREHYGDYPPRTPADKGDDERYRWLYEKLFSADLRNSAPVEVFRSFRVHLKDSDPAFPDPSVLCQQNLLPPGPIRGKMTYVNVFPKKYAYDVEAGEDGLTLRVKIHFRNPTPEDISEFTTKVHAAAGIWNTYRPALDFPYKFRFEVVDAAGGAPFSVAIVNSTRGPYDTVWGRDWTTNTIAHEIGHMMGLGDEYQPVGKAYGCYMPSLMCDAQEGAPMPHHYYFVLRRLMIGGQR